MFGILHENGLACPSTKTPIRPHLSYRHWQYTILLLAGKEGLNWWWGGEPCLMNKGDVNFFSALIFALSFQHFRFGAWTFTLKDAKVFHKFLMVSISGFC